MSNKSFFAKREERFSSAQALFQHLGQLQRLQFDQISEATAKRHKTILTPAQNGQLCQASPADYWEYWIDFGQRSLLYLDALRQRGDNTLAHERAGFPLLLKFPYETLIDGRDLPRPVNYSLLRIIPESEQPSNSERAPVIVIDPRSGQGAGIGGFKQDSAVGESLRAGHPTYFIAFSHSPEPGQTLHDIGVAQARFLEDVAKRHPNSDKPIVIGNCQAGWALMGLAAARPELPGLVIINGAPLSYWAGADGRNPMRYTGGLLGGAWTTRLASDLGNGRFDGAWLVSGYESLNPAESHWNKYYNLFSKIDSEVPDFLDFERWWSSPTLLNSEEIEVIVDDLFIGNRLTGGLGQQSSEVDLKKIEAPVVVFCSYGDDITPPQQALNWIADIYPSDLALRSAGRTIIYLKHATIDHFGIFVSGAVARREHRGLLDASEAIALLAPGLYEMMIEDVPTASGSEQGYEVYFEPRRIADILSDGEDERDRDDEREFALVDQASQLNNTLYEWYVRPWLRHTINEPVAEMIRKMHPFRMQQYAYSSLNPALSWLAGYAPLLRENRQEVSPNNPLLAWQETTSNFVEALLNGYNDVQDASQEMQFHAVYGGLSTLTGAQAPETQQGFIEQQDQDVTEHLRSSLTQGGGVEALSRILLLLGHQSGKFSKDRVEQLAEKSRTLIKEFDIDLETIRAIIDQQGLLVFALPAESLETLPQLLVDNESRKTLLDSVVRLVPELLTAEGAVGELWRQLHQLFDQPMPAFIQPKSSASSARAHDTKRLESQIVGEEKTTAVKAAVKKPAKTAKPKAPTAAAAKQEELPAAAIKTDAPALAAEKSKPIKTAVKKPAKTAKPKAPTAAAAKQEELPAAAIKTDAPASAAEKSKPIKTAVKKPAKPAKPKAPTAAAAKQEELPAAAIKTDAPVSAAKKSTPVNPAMNKSAQPEKPKVPAVAAKQEELPLAKSKADSSASADEKTTPVSAAANKSAKPKEQTIAAKQEELPAAAPQASKENKEK